MTDIVALIFWVWNFRWW